MSSSAASPSSPALDFFTWDTPNGHKIGIALREIGLAYNLHPVNIVKNEQFQPDFLAINPKYDDGASHPRSLVGSLTPGLLENVCLGA